MRTSLDLTSNVENEENEPSRKRKASQDKRPVFIEVMRWDEAPLTINVSMITAFYPIEKLYQGETVYWTGVDLGGDESYHVGMPYGEFKTLLETYYSKS